MTGDHETSTGRDQEAAEYVLGTLRGADRVRFEAALPSDADLRRRVAVWEDRLSGFADALAPVTPPEALWNRIEREVTTPAPLPATTPSTPSLTARLWSSLALWRGAAALATAAACLLAVMVWNPPVPPPQEPALVAVLQAPEGPAFAVRIPAARRANVTPVGERPAPAGNSYELWVVPPRAQPVSLGVIERSGVTPVPLDRLPPDLVRPGALLAVSLEPAGGSPTGAPTGPVLYTGTLVEAR
ncbi:hypothetical protein N825_31730 [Skermanella stibiiresistens SB22]|uniref:Anti-sigma K factor RskA C-terminal domain-containing protein n=1 Tax=Skermanella stibiiresistens SB22 TaxID=1385369 RepID=W9GQH3_9PROT|nr:anti-sigma factor [Skermanella stibiiresistens]EWY36039.1 hypothetical protein N825_31730 [Skermanella stibiiresistens SB22]